MKRFLIALTVLFVVVGVEVKADSFYVNPNGIELTESQYNFISELYHDGYQEVLTQEEYDDLVEYNIFNQPIESNSKTYYENPLGRSTSYTGYSRTITISKSCGTKCAVTLKTVWSGIPMLQSYDVIGMRFKNTSATLYGSGNVSSSSYNVSYNSSSSNFKSTGSGYGYSVKLGNAAGLVITTSATVNTGGTVYGAYEHSTSSISLDTSKSYNITSAGQGSVFAFTGNAVGKFDNVPGVSITT